MPDAHPPAMGVSSKVHLPVLDGVRALAVLMVICFHFWQESGSVQHTLAGKFLVWGQTGVDLFFVLSGFLITGILIDSKGSEHFLRNFYARRILRIFPLYYATLLTFYFIGPLLHLKQWTPWPQSWWFWVYLQNIPETFAPSLANGPGHFWSLAVEEHYYLFWPFLVLLLSYNRLLKAIVLVIGISLVTRATFSHYATFYFTLARLDGLAIGSALAIFARQPRGLAPCAVWAKRLLCVLGPVLVITQLLVSGKDLPVVQIFKSTLIAVVYACFIIFALEEKLGRSVSRLLCGRPLGLIGKYSYGMYVLHPFVRFWLQEAGVPYNFFGMLLNVLLTYLAAWISWTLLEKPFLRLKRSFEYAPNPHPEPMPEPSIAAVPLMNLDQC